MKHTTEELLFAAAVCERVLKLRMAKTVNMSKEEAEAFNALPSDPLIEDALREFDAVATFISEFRSRS
nr:hypothetical protein [uncultured Comamonas sp.]